MESTIADLHLGRILNPSSDGHIQELEDGALALSADGKVLEIGKAGALKAKAPGARVHDHGDALILPGFIDTHVHLAQVFARGQVTGGLLQWLEEAIYPAEQRFEDLAHAEAATQAFIRDRVRNGVTTSAIFLSSHPEAAQRCFEGLAQSGLRSVMGLVHMEHGAPEALCLGRSKTLKATEDLAGRWHGHDDGRIRYALTPRFALSCTAELLGDLGALRASDPSLFVHTHIAESARECAAVAEAFPKAANYLGVYEDAGLVGERTILAHGIHMSDGELAHLSSCKAGVAHCPSSNLFLKSGVFPWKRYGDAGVRFGLGSDVGAGPSMNPFGVMRDAYMIQPSLFLSPEDLLWRATLGGAQALGMSDTIGNFEPGKEADFLIVEPKAHPVIADSGKDTSNANALLQSLVFLGDDRCVAATYVRGQKLG
jgi:guanine deaminase